MGGSKVIASYWCPFYREHLQALLNPTCIVLDEDERKVRGCSGNGTNTSSKLCAQAPLCLEPYVKWCRQGLGRGTIEEFEKETKQGGRIR